ncbi:MAG: hypothetical protein H0W88_11835 [Parachlamydiaceae bacterium]|nr:hypothetical protein [Parachlamydiaceae bacterium]
MKLDYQLFLGFPLNSDYQILLKQTPENLRSLFIQNDPDYLQEVEHEGILYLGKSLGSSVQIQKIDQMEANIFSLLQRLVGNYQYKSVSLVLLPLPIS